MVILVASMVFVIWIGKKSVGMSVLMGLLGVGLAFLRGRHTLGFNHYNIRRFVRSHTLSMDLDKSILFLKKTYNIQIDK